jgi:peptide/nickel transport system permease protein
MPWTRELGKFRGKIIIAVGMGVLLLVIARVLPDPLTQNVEESFASIALPYSLGTDRLGRALSSRLYFGFLYSLGSIALTSLTTLAIAIPTGLLAARSRWAESILNILAGAIWSIPTFIIALIVFVGFKGEWLAVKFALLGAFNWVPIFRSVRDLTGQVQTAYYITFAKALGTSELQVYFQQVLPNVIPGVYPIVLLNLISLFEVEFVLSFLGLSYADPTPTLGGMLRQGIEYLNFSMILLPSILLCIVIQLLIIFERKHVK